MTQNHYSDQAASISIKRDKYDNELPASDPSMHEGATAGEGAFDWNGKQYSQDTKGGFGSYGVEVEDLGQSPKVERGSVDSQATGRGKES